MVMDLEGATLQTDGGGVAILLRIFSSLFMNLSQIQMRSSEGVESMRLGLGPTLVEPPLNPHPHVSVTPPRLV